MTMNEKISKFCSKVDAATVISHIIAIAIMGAFVYYFPTVFIGFVIGGVVGMNASKIKDTFNDVQEKED